MSVEAIIGVVTAVVALLSAAATAPCWAPLCTRDATSTLELLKEKTNFLRRRIKDLKARSMIDAVLFKEVSVLITESEALLGRLDIPMIQELEQRLEQKCMHGFLPHLCVQKQARSEMDEQLIPNLNALIQKLESIISEGNPCRGYTQSRVVAISGRKRNETKEKIWEAALLPDRSKLICIHGALGVGKTEVAKCIHNRALNDENEELFRYVVWVDLEDGADVYKVQDFIAKSLDISLDDGRGSNLKLERALLKMDSFLLVLDSMWKPMSLKDIGIPELVGRRKVIVTSRDSTLCDQMGESTVKFEIQPLASEEEAWELFQKEIEGEINTLLMKEELLQLQREIKALLMAELDGLPLAIIKFAWVLRNAGVDEMNSISVKRKIVEQPFYLHGEDKDLFDHFNHSCVDLDEKLRSCFMYCALFPKGHVINAKELIEYWMWEGLLGAGFDTLQGGATEGETVLQKLQNKHLLQWASSDHEKVKMFSLFRAMGIEKMSKEGNAQCIRSGVTHTSLPTLGRDLNSNVERAFFMESDLKALDLMDNRNCSQLLTLLLQDNPLDLHNLHDDNFFSSMGNLRVLDLSRTNLNTLPSSISRLDKLCALVLRGCSCLKTLPSLSRLQHLIVLDASGSSLEQCPQGLERLKRLRRLDLSKTRVTSFPNRVVGHLRELEELLMLTESGCLWGTTEDNQGAACIEDLIKLKKLSLVQLHLCNIRALNKYISYVEVYTKVPSRFCFLVGGVHGVRGEANSLSIGGIDESKISRNSELNIAVLGSIRELNVLDVSNLSGLSHLFTAEILKPLTKLREVRVKSCGELVELVQGATVAVSLPKLTRLVLFDLPSLKSLCCGQVLHCPELRFIEVWECHNLKFPMINSDHTDCARLKIHVKGERSWWSGQLEWDNNGIPAPNFSDSPGLHSCFTFTEANAPAELAHHRATRLQWLDSQAEQGNVVIQPDNAAYKIMVGTVALVRWAQRNLIGTNSREDVITNPPIQDTPHSNANPLEIEATSRVESQTAQEQRNGISSRWRIIRDRFLRT